MKIAAPRGTQDILPSRSNIWQKIEAEAIKIFSSAGFAEIRTPIFEASELFNRAVGEDSDIVNKEMYTFNDRSDRSLTLRPEATASIARAFIENSLDREGKPQKLWYRGPMFRYERPQTGRYRQFHQIGIEALGAEAPYIDLEIIRLGIDLLENLGLDDLTLYINSIGNKSSRQNYISALKEFLAKIQDQVCDDCKRRFIQNPLRCLDCKVPEDQKLYSQAPIIHDYFDEESQTIWSQMQTGLTELGIKYVVDPKLVRGLDYYSHCVFEVKSNSTLLGTQSTVLAGGRYDNLVETLGGPSTPAVGWAIGMERLVLIIKEPEITNTSIYIISDSSSEAQKLAHRLRIDTNHEMIIEYDYENSKFKKQLERAVKKSSDWVVFYMNDERQSGKFKIKDLKNAKEISDLNYEELVNKLKL